MSPEAMPPETAPVASARARWRRAGVRAERLLWVGVAAFALYRLGPQLAALTGVGPALGRAPDLRVVTLDGRTLGPEDLAGKVVVVNFWATWCPPCRLEIPSLEKLHERRAGEGVVVLGLATDAGGEAPIRAFLDERHITYAIGRATAAQRAAFGGIPAIPTTFLIDRSGVVRHRVVGYFAPPALNAAVGRLLEERPPGSAAADRTDRPAADAHRP